jgi:hypothetical protein
MDGHLWEVESRRNTELVTAKLPKTPRQTRTVVDPGPAFIRRDTLVTQGVQDVKRYNNTDEDAQWDYTTVEKTGEHSAVTATKQASLTVGANVNIGPFAIKCLRYCLVRTIQHADSGYGQIHHGRALRHDLNMH